MFTPRCNQATVLAVVCILHCVIRGVVGLKSEVDLQSIQWLGRFDTTNGSYKSDWPFSGFNFAIMAQSTNVSIDIKFGTSGSESGLNFYIEHIVDCAVSAKHQVTATPDNAEGTVVPLTIDTAEVGHVYDVELRKVTEAANGDAFGLMEIVDISLNGAIMVVGKGKDKIATASTCHKKSKVLVIGDSISAAYGVDGDYPCSFSADTENVHHGWTGISSDELSLDLQVVAWSGKGVVRNYGDASQTSIDPMPVFYNRTLATGPLPTSTEDVNYWHPTQFAAELVMVMLGSNDYSTDPVPTDDQFISGLKDLLLLIRDDYPDAQIAAVCSPSATGAQCTNIAQAVEEVGFAKYIFVDPNCYDGGYGCDYHPNGITQQNIADVLVPYMRALLAL